MSDWAEVFPAYGRPPAGWRPLSGRVTPLRPAELDPRAETLRSEGWLVVHPGRVRVVRVAFEAGDWAGAANALDPPREATP
jgi:hypothetical protein